MRKNGESKGFSQEEKDAMAMKNSTIEKLTSLIREQKIESGYKKVNEGPGATLGMGPSAGAEGVKDNAYVKQFKYKVVPQTAEGTYVQKGSGMEVKKLF